MEYSKIKHLLKKYYQGETSVEEEKLLRDYFLLGSVSNELKKEKELFISFAKIDSEISAGTELENNLLDLVENKWQELNKNRFKQIVKWSVGAAASFFIAFLLLFNTEKNESISKDTFTNKKEAYEATKDALVLVSEKMKMASEKLSNLQQINYSFEKVKPLLKVNKVIDKYQTEKQIDENL